mmetsp:Transcript_26204/g.61571  ORF Transcript_26204/g.61571 Transcript_26204/m.61571 type:complete len:113 (-) Transcript_26204:33-371(-)
MIALTTKLYPLKLESNLERMVGFISLISRARTKKVVQVKSHKTTIGRFSASKICKQTISTCIFEARRTIELCVKAGCKRFYKYCNPTNNLVVVVTSLEKKFFSSTKPIQFLT